MNKKTDSLASNWRWWICSLLFVATTINYKFIKRRPAKATMMPRMDFAVIFSLKKMAAITIERIRARPWFKG